MSRYIILSTGYNCEKFIDEWYESIKNQTDKDFIVVAIDDASTDSTYDKLKDISDKDKRIIVRRNSVNKSAIYNQTIVLKNVIDLQDEDVICILDLDDYLMPDAIETIKYIYDNNDVWITYGSFQPREFDPSKPMNELPIRKQWIYSHFRTFKWFLYKNIKDADMKYSNGDLIRECVDRLIMYPMLEMAGKDKCYFNDKIIYNYRMHDMNEYLIKPYSNYLANVIMDEEPYEQKTKEELVKGECDWK